MATAPIEFTALEEENEKLRSAISSALELLAFHEGSEEKITEDGNPVIWINANGPDGDFQTILRTLREAVGQ